MACWELRTNRNHKSYQLHRSQHQKHWHRTPSLHPTKENLQFWLPSGEQIAYLRRQKDSKSWQLLVANFLVVAQWTFEPAASGVGELLKAQLVEPTIFAARNQDRLLLTDSRQADAAGVLVLRLLVLFKSNMFAAV